MRCPKCGVNNYGDVTSCHSCGEALTQAQTPAQHRYGPCPHCGNPQAEYFAGGRGQCRACVRTFTWRQELLQKEQPEEAEASPTMMYMVIAIVIAVALVGAGIGAYFLTRGGDDDGGDGDGDIITSDYFETSDITTDTVNPIPNQNITVYFDITFLKPNTYDTKKIHVELFFSYISQSTGARVDSHSVMNIGYWLTNTTNLTSGDELRYVTVVSFDDITGPVSLEVKIYSTSVWINTKPLDDKTPLATSGVHDDVLVF